MTSFSENEFQKSPQNRKCKACIKKPQPKITKELLKGINGEHFFVDNEEPFNTGCVFPGCVEPAKMRYVSNRNKNTYDLCPNHPLGSFKSCTHQQCTFGSIGDTSLCLPHLTATVRSAVKRNSTKDEDRICYYHGCDEIAKKCYSFDLRSQETSIFSCELHKGTFDKLRNRKQDPQAARSRSADTSDPRITRSRSAKSKSRDPDDKNRSLSVDDKSLKKKANDTSSKKKAKKGSRDETSEDDNDKSSKKKAKKASKSRSLSEDDKKGSDDVISIYSSSSEDEKPLSEDEKKPNTKTTKKKGQKGPTGPIDPNDLNKQHTRVYVDRFNKQKNIPGMLEKILENAFSHPKPKDDASWENAVLIPYPHLPVPVEGKFNDTKLACCAYCKKCKNFVAYHWKINSKRVKSHPCKPVCGYCDVVLGEIAANVCVVCHSSVHPKCCVPGFKAPICFGCSEKKPGAASAKKGGTAAASETAVNAVRCGHCKEDLDPIDAKVCVSCNLKVHPGCCERGLRYVKCLACSWKESSTTPEGTGLHPGDHSFYRHESARSNRGNEGGRRRSDHYHAHGRQAHGRRSRSATPERRHAHGRRSRSATPERGRGRSRSPSPARGRPSSHRRRSRSYDRDKRSSW
jgi:hypothetical protein